MSFVIESKSLLDVKQTTPSVMVYGELSHWYPGSGVVLDCIDS